ncbi:MAG TPA: alpha/beta hydrolase [Nocardioides sp.]|uniref:alpha/beta fold hydrolase n=1 Tax=Nocardioides sp. TaxID=35761 RepID=UPI002E2F015C|nr:alpha/beta hydrolase [Nocardioides sp.]HEX3932286.1 alpha/beta hydrolase [Nocardioides sp.]
METFGEQGDPALLLIAGTSGPMDGWDEGFCQLLASGGRYVIRYDNRDTGQSTSYPPGAPPYGFDDFVDDAIGLLDALGVERFHVAGGSLGGAVARGLALRQPERVQSLTLLSSTPLAPGDPRDPTLPPPTAAFLEFAGAERPAPDWGDRQAYIDNYALWDRQFAGPDYFDEDKARDYAGRVFDRTLDIHAASVNHSASSRGTTQIRARHAEITHPVLVIHGTEDPILPFRHAQVLAHELPHSKLLPLAGVGHQLLPHEFWPIVATEMLDHTGRG